MSHYNLRSKARASNDKIPTAHEDWDEYNSFIEELKTKPDDNEIIKSITTVVFIMLIGCVFLALLLNKTSYSYS
jgi:hypothetical protein